jgi:hypothetical protein
MLRFRKSRIRQVLLYGAIGLFLVSLSLKTWMTRFSREYTTMDTTEITNTIHFIHVYDNRPNARNWCSIESALRLGANVVVHSSDPSVFMEFPAPYRCQLNFQRLDFSSLFESTPLQTYYERQQNETEVELPRQDLSNAARLALIFKKGGVYSDLDIIWLKDNLFRGTNKIAAQHPPNNYWHGHYFNNNYLCFQREHPFLFRAMKNFNLMWKPFHNWGVVGPQLLTKTEVECGNIRCTKPTNESEQFCSKLQELHPTQFHCNSFDRLDYKAIQFISNEDLYKLKTNSNQLYDEILAHASGIHFSNMGIGKDILPVNSILHKLMEQFCPAIAKHFFTELFSTNE